MLTMFLVVHSELFGCLNDFVIVMRAMCTCTRPRSDGRSAKYKIKGREWECGGGGGGESVS